MKLLFVDDEIDWLEELSDFASSLPDVSRVRLLSHPAELEAVLQDDIPDLIGLDLNMQPLNGLQVAQMLSWRNSPPILLISAHLPHYPLHVLMDTGIRGMLSKDQLSRQLHPALLALHNGQTWFPQPEICKMQQQQTQQQSDLLIHWEQLTPRQKDVCLLFSQGHPPTEIAACLQIGPETVKSHLRQARQIFGVNQGYALLARLHNLRVYQIQETLKNTCKHFEPPNNWP